MDSISPMLRRKILLFFLWGAAGCSSLDPGKSLKEDPPKELLVPAGPVKVYVSRPELGGMVRNQASDPEERLIPYWNTELYRCMSKKDFDVLLMLLQRKRKPP